MASHVEDGLLEVRLGEALLLVFSLVRVPRVLRIRDVRQQALSDCLYVQKHGQSGCLPLHRGRLDDYYLPVLYLEPILDNLPHRRPLFRRQESLGLHYHARRILGVSVRRIVVLSQVEEDAFVAVPHRLERRLQLGTSLGDKRNQPWDEELWFLAR